MSIIDGLSLLAIAGAIGFVLLCALTDLRRYTIPNKYCLGILLCGFAYAGLNFSTFPWGAHAAALLLVFLSGALLFNFALLGGGDVKMLSALSFWVGLYDLPLFLLMVVLWGGVLSVGAMALYFWSKFRHGEKSDEVIGIAHTIVGTTSIASVAEVTQAAKTFKKFGFMKLRVPYGIAIAAGSVYFFVRIIGHLGVSVG